MMLSLALAAPQVAHTMPNDPDVKGLVVARAILPDAYARMAGGTENACYMAQFAPAADVGYPLWPSWSGLSNAGLKSDTLYDLRHLYPEARPIPDDIVDADEFRAILGKVAKAGDSKSCNVLISFSLPRVAKGWAFLHAARYVRVGLGDANCELAYRREGGKWRLVAMAMGSVS